jgi:hypothetical protein
MSDSIRDREQRLTRMLEELPRTVEPARELWPAIEAQLLAGTTADTVPPESRSARHPSARRWFWQLAAAVVLVTVSSLLTATLINRDAAHIAAAPPPVTEPPGLFAMPAAFGPAHALDAEYDTARRELAAMLAQRIDTMPPSAVQKLEANLAEMQRATREINSALELRPGDPLLEELLLNTYQAELSVLANASQLSRIDGAVTPLDPTRTRL